jgi:phenylalanyl-tRNA synthetase beta chain
MKVSLNHLKELVETDITAVELSKLFNLHSSEVEETYQLVDATNLVVGYVTEKVKHPDADKLSVCQVDIGGEISQIVCGAPNVDKGQYVVVSKVGAVLAGGFKIKKSSIRGIESNGMICSLAELGIDKKFVYSDGIYVINEKCKAGDDPLSLLNLEDEVMALDITPNRADLLSVMGVALDTSTILDVPLKFKVPEVKAVKKENPVSVKIETENCYSYYARVIEDIIIKDSPNWMQSRLIAAGIRPINNIVDITNYVMIETGQPLHAFDYDLLGSDIIGVRMAHEGEEFKTLDEQIRKLTKEDIVITNGDKSVALGGVMGGFDTEIKEGSNKILLESAVFNPTNIRKTSKRLDLRSEASIRFERKIDPKRTILALNMAASLFHKYANGKILKDYKFEDNIDYSEPVINTSTKQINDNLGTNLSTEEISDILRRLHFEHQIEDKVLSVILPSRRQDMETYQDIVEEVGRIYGYDKLPLTLPTTVSKGQLSDSQMFIRNIKNKMTDLGLNEVLTYSLINEERIDEFTKSKANYTKVASPMSIDRHVLTSSPLNGIIDVIKYNNARKNKDMFVFEVGKRYNEDEKIVLSGALTGLFSETNWQGRKEVVDFYTVKGLLDSLFESLYLGHVEYEPMTDYKNLHPGQSAYIKDYSGVIGFIGKLHPQYAESHSLKNVYVFELEVDKMITSRRVLKKVKEINKFPEVSRDIAIVLDDSTTTKEVLDIIKKAGKRMLIKADVFDLYKGSPLDDNQKSLAISLTFSDTKRTLETKEVDQRVNEILGILKAKLKAELR